MKRDLKPFGTGRAAGRRGMHVRAGVPAPFDLDLVALLAARADGFTTLGLTLLARELTANPSMTDRDVLEQLNSLLARGLVTRDAEGRWRVKL